MKALELTGRRFGRLEVLERAGSKYGHSLWRCRCDCGKETFVLACSLQKGETLSCGCLKDENTAKRSSKHKKAELGYMRCGRGSDKGAIIRIMFLITIMEAVELNFVKNGTNFQILKPGLFRMDMMKMQILAYVQSKELTTTAHILRGIADLQHGLNSKTIPETTIE